MNINATLFVQMLVFFVGAWITMKYIWPPINKAIEERQQKIAEGLAAADKGEAALEEARKQGLAIEADARAQSQTIVSQGEKRGQSIIDEAKAQAQIEADKIIAAAREQAAQELQQARDQLRDQVAGLVVAGASEILGKEVDEKAHQQILEKFKASL